MRGNTILGYSVMSDQKMRKRTDIEAGSRSEYSLYACASRGEQTERMIFTEFRI